jgi:hypothetical protein
MLTLLILYLYTTGVCTALISVGLWAAWKGERAAEFGFAIAAALLSLLMLSGLSGATFNYEKSLIFVVVSELGLGAIALVLHSLIATSNAD